MEAYFNELSLSDEVADVYRMETDLAEVYRFLKANDVNACRISAEYLHKLCDCFSGNGHQNIRNMIYSFFHVPYENPDLDEKQDVYIESEYSINGKECIGLAYAFVTDSLTVSLSKKPWTESLLSISKSGMDVSVHNIANQNNENVISEWFSEIFPVELMPTDIPISRKNIHISGDHHGKHELLEFADKIVKSEYVKEVISIEHKSESRRFINQTFADGIIHITLPWTNLGLSVAVQTTGRNKRETDEIAKILDKKYGHR